MEIRNCKLQEREKVINLINNIFRVKEGLAPTMDKEFLCLLGENNIENNIICVDNEDVVGCVNYYQSNICIGDAKIKVSSIGAVCTREDYRGKNIVCRILEEGDKQALDKESCMLIISGNRKVYLNHGACEATLNKKYIISENKEYDIELKEYEESMFNDLFNLYSCEFLKFERERKEFDDLLKGAMFNWGKNINKLFLIFEDNMPKAYLMIKLMKDSREASVRELAGDRKYIFKAIHKIKNMYDLDALIVSVPVNDKLIEVMKENNINGILENQWGTVKIIDIERLINSLRPYLRQYVNDEELDKLKIKVGYEGYKFIYEDIDNTEEFIIENIYELNMLVLGNKEYSLEFMKEGKLKSLLYKMFPIPFVNIFGMNFQ